MTFDGTELWQLSVLELAEAIRSRRVSSRDVVEAHLRRIEAVNPIVNAVPVVLAEQALRAAAAADRAQAAGERLRPLHGVPVTVKGSIDVAGTPTTQGVTALAGAYPAVDAPAVRRLRRAGAIVIGRGNLASNAVRWHCESELWGATVNPWDRSRTPGASSGGDAVAAATGMTPLGLGSDGLGSLRWPAQCCGIATLKPTLGRIPDASSIGPGLASIGAQLSVVVGPIARRVADLRSALTALAGATWRDPWSVQAPLRGPDPDRPVRVALVADPVGFGTAPEIQDAVRAAGAALADAGYVVDELEPPSLELAARTLLDMLNTPEIRAALPEQLTLCSPESVRFLTEFYETAGPSDPVSTVGAFAVRQALLREWGEFQQERPLIVAPICTEPPFAVGTDLGDGRVAAMIRAMRMALAVNALGLPAVAVPVGVASGLPQVVQVIGARYREDLCLDAAEAVEERLGVLTPIDPR